METGWISSEFIVKSENKNNTIIAGYASVFGIIDADNDVMNKGAFSEAHSKNVKLLWQHDQTKPIGVVNFLKEDEYGLKFEAEINNKTRLGAETSELIKQKAISGISVGFKINASDYKGDGTRVINSADLKEISVVTFPANNQAQIQYVKNEKQSTLSLEQKLDRLAKLIKQIENY